MTTVNAVRKKMGYPPHKHKMRKISSSKRWLRFVCEFCGEPYDVAKQLFYTGVFTPEDHIGTWPSN